AALEAWRREQTFVAKRLDALNERLSLRRRQIRVDVFLGERLTSERRRPRREGLRRERMLSRRVGLRHRPFLDRPDRAAGLALEDEQEALLRRLRDDIDIAAVLADRQQLRRLGQVVVPQIVMHQLVMPNAFAGARVERHERVAEQICARTIAAIEIEARAAEADERNA